MRKSGIKRIISYREKSRSARGIVKIAGFSPISLLASFVISTERQRQRNPSRSHGKISRFARNDSGGKYGKISRFARKDKA